MSFGNFIRKARRVLGLRQLYIADLIGVSLSTYSQVEAGVQPPFAPWLIDYDHLASILHVTEGELRAVAAGERENITHYRIDDYGEINPLANIRKKNWRGELVDDHLGFTTADDLSELATFLIERSWSDLEYPNEERVSFFTDAGAAADKPFSTWEVSIDMDPVFSARKAKP